MAEFSIHQSLSQQQTLAPQMRKSLEILQAGTLELSQLITQALETNPVLEDATESVSLDEDTPVWVGPRIAAGERLVLVRDSTGAWASPVHVATDAAVR